ncbi:hypothetical protein GCM10009115_12130 [Sphingopyxis soli]|uniref:DUF2785 domain-containing protein n=1 Tax=Sphingopyxis soli TaxID=592051 RepID=A0ABP3XF91_9SPHN|nr:DUF2785 domain-containing protein [Sphingopyxis soli]
MRHAGMLVAAMMLAASPAAAGAASTCAVARPADGDLKAYAATFFAKARLGDLEALAACLGDPDPAMRDGFAFTLWSEGLRGRHLSAAQMRRTLALLTEMAAVPEDAAGFRRPFAALALSEIARADRIEAWMTDAELHALARTGAAYLRGVTDYRGFVPGEGWRHGVAHGSDLALQLALNPRLARADADLLLGAIASQVAPAASPYYHHGESARLARPVLFLARRADIDDAAWAAWFKTLYPDSSARWKDVHTGDAGLAAVHNTTGFANAIYVSAAEAQDPQIKRLAPLAVELLKALP